MQWLYFKIIVLTAIILIRAIFHKMLQKLLIFENKTKQNLLVIALCNDNL